MHNEPLTALDNVTCYALDSISKLWTPIGEGLIVYGCIVIQINSLKCTVEEREREGERDRHTNRQTSKQTGRQRQSERVCTIGLLSKFNDKANNCNKHDQAT